MVYSLTTSTAQIISTSPNLDAVEVWLSSGCGVLESTLASMGYSVPVATDTVLWSWLRHLNTLFAAAYAEMSRVNTTISAGERTRGQIYLAQFNDSLKNLQNMNLSAMGATENTAGGMTMFVGGISNASKETYQQDSDRVKPRFFKGLFDMPDTTRPSGG